MDEDYYNTKLSDLSELALDILDLYEECKYVLITKYADPEVGRRNLKIEIEEFKNEINGFK